MKLCTLSLLPLSSSVTVSLFTANNLDPKSCITTSVCTIYDSISIFKPVIKKKPFPFGSCARHKKQVKIIINKCYVSYSMLN